MLDFSRPEHIDDILPPAAAAMAGCGASALAWLAAHDYQLVIPPLADYIETLTGGDDALNLQTFKITDTLSGRTLGIRADQTPQIARVDAGAINGESVRRYCYCGPTLRARPPQPWQAREGMQLGAELFGAPAGSGDWEVASVALGALAAMGLESLCIDLGHAGLFADITAGLPADVRRRLTEQVARRDVSSLKQLIRQEKVPQSAGDALCVLAQSAGGLDTLAAARPHLPAAPLDTLEYVARQLQNEGYDVGVSLSDSGSYGYHSGVVFNIYAHNCLVARGGRYQRGGLDAGAGFSADLRAAGALAAQPPVEAAVNVPLAPQEDSWRQAVAELRRRRRRLRFVHAEDAPPPPALQKQAEQWVVREQ